jgi:hypothetical protein
MSPEFHYEVIDELFDLRAGKMLVDDFGEDALLYIQVDEIGKRYVITDMENELLERLADDGNLRRIGMVEAVNLRKDYMPYTFTSLGNFDLWANISIP